MQVILFDLDGTLFDTRKDIANAVNFARRRYSLPELPLDQVTAMVGDGVPILAERAFGGTGVSLEEAVDSILEYYLAHPADESAPYPGVKETLPRIEPIKTIVSNKPENLVRELLNQHELDRYFDFVAGGDTFPEKKPSPVSLRYILSRYSIGENDILVVGDHQPDIQMARTCGVRSVYCNYGFFGRDVVGADFAIDSFPEILDILERFEQAGE